MDDMPEYVPGQEEEKAVKPLRGYARLDQGQKDFIDNKVKELGSYIEADKFYISNGGVRSLVDRYALKCARAQYPEDYSEFKKVNAEEEADAEKEHVDGDGETKAQE